MTSTLGTYNPLRYRGYVYDTDTGLYYLQSRYYNPEMGRFINADSYASTGQGILGDNMFAYCLNNPVNHQDPNGMWTLTFGISINATAVVGVAIGIGISFDDKGGIALQWNYSLPDQHETATVGLLDVGVALQGQWTNKESVDDLNGISTYSGASGGILGYGGIDAVGDAPAADLTGKLSGVQLALGLGVGVDIHVAQTKTQTIQKSSWREIWHNVQDWWDSLW